MTKKELKAAIRAKEKEIRELQTKSAASNDVEEVRSIGDDLQKIIDELDDLKAQLDELEEEDGNARGFDPMAAYGGNVRAANGMRVVGSFGGVPTVGASNAALKRGETMASRCADKASKNLDLGKYIRGIATGDWTNATEERSAMNTSALGAVIPSFLSAQIIDAARNVSLFGAAGVPVYPMEGNNLTIARVASDPVFKFKAEAAEGEEATFNLDSVELNSKTAYGYAYVSLEALHSAKNLTDILYRVFSQAIADAIDKGILYGQYNTSTSSYETFAPAGIMNDENVNEIIATNTGYNDFIRAIGKVKRANGMPSIMAINAATEEELNLFYDDNFNYQEAPEAIKTMQQIVTNQLAYDEDDGSDALIFDPNALIIGMQNNIVVRMITDSDECIKKGLVGFQIYAMLDGKAVRPKHICKVTGFKGTHPASEETA